VIHPVLMGAIVRDMLCKRDPTQKSEGIVNKEKPVRCDLRDLKGDILL